MKQVNNIFYGLIGTILVTVWFGSYGYTAMEIEKEQKEKQEWRVQHQIVLDKKFEEIRDAQKELKESIKTDTEDVKKVLKEILTNQQQQIRQRR